MIKKMGVVRERGKEKVHRLIKGGQVSWVNNNFLRLKSQQPNCTAQGFQLHLVTESVSHAVSPLRLGFPKSSPLKKNKVYYRF